MTDIVVGTREWMVSGSQHRNSAVYGILKHFAWAHLPEELQPYSKNCADLALQMCAMLKDSPELTVGLRKLLEAKDSFVRASLEV